MDELAQAVLMTAAIPGALVGLLCSFRSGILMTLLGIIVGGLGGIGGGLGLTGLLNTLGVVMPEGPITVVIGSIAGAFILLLLTSGLRQPARS
jgi:hypothetical protein